MAITFINQIPTNKFLPSRNPINVTVDSNNNGKCNFRYVCDVYIDNANVFRFKLFPDPSTGYGFFQLSDVISDYLSEYLPVTNSTSIVVGTTNTFKSVVSCYLRFGEEYDNSTNCDGDIVVYPNLATSNTFYPFLGTLDYEEWPSYNQSYYVVDYSTPYVEGTGPYFLTKRPRGSVKCSFGDSYYLDWISVAAPNNGQTRIRIETNTGVTYSVNAPSLSSVKRFRAAVGPFDINNSANTPIINGSQKWYDVWLEDSGNQLTEKFRIELEYPKSFRTRFGFVGSLGSIEYITFFHRNRTGYNIDRKDYKKYLTSNKGSGNWSYAVGDRQSTTYATNAKEAHNVTTFVDESTSQWLWEMWTSINVWKEDRPLQSSFRVFREDSTPTSRMLFWLPVGHGFKAGDSFFSIPENKTEYQDYVDRFTITSVNGNIVDCGLTYNIYNITESACGWIFRDETFRRIPIVISDQSVDVKQRLSRPIEYSLNYTNSVDKFTLRG